MVNFLVDDNPSPATYFYLNYHEAATSLRLATRHVGGARGAGMLLSRCLFFCCCIFFWGVNVGLWAAAVLREARLKRRVREEAGAGQVVFHTCLATAEITLREKQELDCTREMWSMSAPKLFNKC